MKIGGRKREEEEAKIGIEGRLDEGDDRDWKRR